VPGERLRGARGTCTVPETVNVREVVLVETKELIMSDKEHQLYSIVIITHYHSLPVVPHKAVAEVSKIGNL
jgi:hypothetical protein